MIFSLSTSQATEEVAEIAETDIFCFFHSQNSVLVPSDLMWISIVSSLKLKKNVLILEENLAQMPSLGTSRWVVGDKFLYLAPRASSVLLEASLEKSNTYQLVKAYLMSFK